jgi:ORF6N domain
VLTQQPAGARLPDIHCRLGKVSPKRKAAKAPLPEVELAELIQWIRGEKVILDRDLARLYQVEVKVLNQAVKRNSSRFPGDFMFQLTAVEAESLRSQVVTLDGVAAAVSSAKGRGKHLKYRPYAFTEQGVVGKAP